MSLLDAREGKRYQIRSIDLQDDALTAFLFSLGCYSQEPITVVKHRRNGCTVSIKNGRYHMDRHLAKAILIG